MRDDGGELSDLWYQKQRKGQEGRGRRLVDDFWKDKRVVSVE